MPYAENTKVPVSRSKQVIEEAVKKYGAEAFGVMERTGFVTVVFTMNGRNILFRKRIEEDPQVERASWRALLLTIKGKLESAARGIETFEEAFLANIVMPDGRTVAETTTPQIAASYEGRDVPLLPNYG